MRRLALLALLAACDPVRAAPDSPLTSTGPAPQPLAPGAKAEIGADAAAAPTPETALGVADRGIFPDLDGAVQLSIAEVDPARARLVLDPGRGLLLLYDGGRPAKVYPAAGSAALTIGGRTVALRPGDALELRPFAGAPLGVLGPKERAPGGDADGDGIPDVLDLLIGARKVAANGADYGGQYIEIPYPGGDLPREMGVCTDVVVRALRNAGIDIQRELHVDIGRAPAAYPFVKRADANIDHRRVKTLVPYLQRHWARHTARLDDPADPLLPGDVLIFDAYANKPSPDHIAIVSERRGPSGHLMVIHNDRQESEEDTLTWAKVIDRYRLR